MKTRVPLYENLRNEQLKRVEDAWSNGFAAGCFVTGVIIIGLVYLAQM